MKCFKQFILYLIVVAILIIILTVRSNKEQTEYTSVIKVKDDSIRILEKRNQQLEAMFQNSIDSAKKYKLESAYYNASLIKLKEQSKYLKSDYENKINDISSISTDSLYFVLTRWYNER